MKGGEGAALINTAKSWATQWWSAIFLSVLKPSRGPGCVIYDSHARQLTRGWQDNEFSMRRKKERRHRGRDLKERATHTSLSFLSSSFPKPTWAASSMSNGGKVLPSSQQRKNGKLVAYLDSLTLNFPHLSAHSMSFPMVNLKKSKLQRKADMVSIYRDLCLVAGARDMNNAKFTYWLACIGASLDRMTSYV